MRLGWRRLSGRWLLEVHSSGNPGHGGVSHRHERGNPGRGSVSRGHGSRNRGLGAGTVSHRHGGRNPGRCSVSNRHGSRNRGRCSVSNRRSDVAMLVLREVVVPVVYARSRILCRATSRLRSVITCFN
jgi:hypothetical protein